MLHTSIWESEKFGKLSDKAKILYIAAITFGDDEGRLKINANLMRSRVFPYDDWVTTKIVQNCLDKIKEFELMEFYVVDGQEYALHPKWTNWQILRKDRFRSSECPQPLASGIPTQPPGNQTATSDGQMTAEPRLTEPRLTEPSTAKPTGGAAAPSKKMTQKDFDDFWKKYPNKQGKEDAQKKFLKLDRTLLLKIFEKLEEFKNSKKWQENGGEFIPHGSTWVNGKRWNDDVKARIIPAEVRRDTAQKKEFEKYEQEAKASPVRPETLAKVKAQLAEKMAWPNLP